MTTNLRANKNAPSSQRGRKSVALRGSTHHSERRADDVAGVTRSCLADIGAAAVAWRDDASPFGAELAGGILAACALSDGSQPVAVRLCQVRRDTRPAFAAIALFTSV